MLLSESGEFQKMTCINPSLRCNCCAQDLLASSVLQAARVLDGCSSIIESDIF